MEFGELSQPPPKMAKSLSQENEQTNNKGSSPSPDLFAYLYLNREIFHL